MIVLCNVNDRPKFSSLSQLLCATLSFRSAICLASALPNSSLSFQNAVAAVLLQPKALLIPKQYIRTRKCPLTRPPTTAVASPPPAPSSLSASLANSQSIYVSASSPSTSPPQPGPKCPAPRLPLFARGPARPRPHHPSPIIRLGPRRPRKRVYCYTVAV